MSSNCPRCGAEMSGGICDNCGFPLTKIRRRIFVNNTRNEGDRGKLTKEQKSFQLSYL